MLAANGAAGESVPLAGGSAESLGRAVAGEDWDESNAAAAAGRGNRSGWESWAAAGTIEGAAHKASGFVNRTLTDFRPVSDDMLNKPPPADWLSWRRTLDGHGYSPLTQVNQGNVKDLKLAWVLTMGEGSNQATPLVHDGIMYLAVPGNIVQAVQAATGDVIWEYAYPYPPESRTLGGPTRNLAIHQDRLFMATYDAAIVALDARTGELLWRKIKADYTQGYTHTSGPIVANGVVISGINGCERFKQGGCFITGHDPVSGEELWRTSTIALPGDPHESTWAELPMHLRAGGDTWIPGSYDPELDLFYIGTSQAKPWVAASRGMSPLDAALYTNSTLALRPKTGEIAWYFQHIPGETLDMEVGFERVLVDMDGQKWVVTVGKDGILWKLDRVSGRFVDFVETMPQNIFEPLDRTTGRLKYRQDIIEAGIGEPISACPSIYGGHNWQATAFSPELGVLIIPLHQLCVEMIGREVQMVEGYGGYGGESRVFPMPGSEGMLGRLTAWDLRTMKPLWNHEQRAMFLTSALVTGGGLAFIGDLDRRFKAFAMQTGELLWQARLGAALHGFPISYAVDGEQYIAVPTGMGVFKLLTAKQSPEIYQPNGGNALYVFKLPRPD
ncbi:MAG TPA: PQQ-binding-like beta-propeller repeat protein [Xanthomonadales bacterium]|nr:PQQ-binding-like beta-propeller repeat protein [Xanthomonadales bacterium]